MATTDCPKCGNGDRPSYKGRKICKDCYRLQRKAHRKRSQKFVYEFKLLNNKCSDCLNSYPPCVLEFDHSPKEKKFMAVANMAAAGFSIKLIYSEIQKCEIVCANCHRMRTQNRKGPRQ